MCFQSMRRGSPTLPPDLVQEIDNDFVLMDPHTIEVFPNSVCELVLALFPLLLLSSHGGRHSPDGRGREDQLVILFVERSGCVQAVIMSVSVEDRWFKCRPLYLRAGVSGGLLSRREGLLTPGLGSELDRPGTPAAAVLCCPAVTTSRRELPGAALPPGRRPLPLTALEMLVVPTFSLVLDASDLESSG